MWYVTENDDDDDNDEIYDDDDDDDDDDHHHHLHHLIHAYNVNVLKNSMGLFELFCLNSAKLLLLNINAILH